MSARQRFEHARAFETAILDDLRRKGFMVMRNGSEDQRAEFVDGLQTSRDPTSLFIRFQPDLIARVGPRSVYIDPKAGGAIEKLAWEQYLRLAAAGCLLVIVSGKQEPPRWNFLTRLRLIDGQETVARFPTPPPVIDGWGHPRASAHWNEAQRHTNPQASGTAYREIDESSLLPWAALDVGVLQTDPVALAREGGLDEEMRLTALFGQLAAAVQQQWLASAVPESQRVHLTQQWFAESGREAQWSLVGALMHYLLVRDCE